MAIPFVINYLTHNFSAKTRHGVHSPFVYKLVDEVIYDLVAKEEYTAIEKLRQALKQDHRTITITDLGAGSHYNNNKKKKISELAKNALKPPRLAKLIHRLARHMKPSNIIELGTCLGITTAYLSEAAPKAHITSIEGCPETASVAEQNFKTLGLENIQLRVGNFDQILPDVISIQDKLDFVFVDGNHRKQATIDYFNACLPKVHENTLLIFDDIYWSKGMKEAWQHIKDHPDVTVTVDLFWIGLVFFRKGQVKEHFKIRF